MSERAGDTGVPGVGRDGLQARGARQGGRGEGDVERVRQRAARALERDEEARAERGEQVPPGQPSVHPAGREVGGDDVVSAEREHRAHRAARRAREDLHAEVGGREPRRRGLEENACQRRGQILRFSASDELPATGVKTSDRTSSPAGVETVQ